MQTVEQTSLFTDLSAEEASTINGAWGYYPVYNCYPVYYGYGGYGYGGGYGGGYSSGYGSSSSVSQTTNVNVLIED